MLAVETVVDLALELFPEPAVWLCFAAEEFGERMEAAMVAKTIGELDELMEDLPVIDLYQLPDASLRRRPPRSGSSSLLPSDWLGGPGSPARFTAGTVAMGAWAVTTSAWPP